MTQEDLELYRTLRFYVTEGMSPSEAAADLGISYQRASFILARGKTTPSELRERRKQYIVKAVTNRRTGHRHTPHVIGCYFKVDESYVVQLMRELRSEGRLPPLTEKDKEWQDDLLLELRKRYPMVCRAETVGKKKDVGDKVFVSGRGFLTWAECKRLLPPEGQQLRSA